MMTTTTQINFPALGAFKKYSFEVAAERSDQLYNQLKALIEASEEKVIAVSREVFEETGWEISAGVLNHHGTLYERIPQLGDYILEVFHAECTTCPDVVLDLSEHSDFKWVLKDNFLKEDLMLGQADLYRTMYSGRDFLSPPAL